MGLSKKWRKWRNDNFQEMCEEGTPWPLAAILADQNAKYYSEIDKVNKSTKEANKKVCNWYFSHADLIGRKPSLDKWPESIYLKP